MRVRSVIGGVLGKAGAFAAIAGLVIVIAVAVFNGPDVLGLVGAGMLWGGIGVAWLSDRIARRGVRGTRSDRLASADSLATGHLKGQYEVTLQGRTKPMYELTVGDVPVILWGSTVAVGGDRQWKIRARRKRVTVRSEEGVRLAEATRMASASKRWRVSDDVSAYEVAVETAKEKAKTRNPGERRIVASSRSIARTCRILRAGGIESALGEVRVIHEQTGRRHNRVWSYTGRLVADMDLSESISVPIAVLVLRLTLGRWVIRAPRTGAWDVHPGA